MQQNKSLTFETIRDSINRLKEDINDMIASQMSIPPEKLNNHYPSAWQILFKHQHKIIESLKATKNTKKRLFKKSKNRSKRLRKKLLKRFDGYEFKQEPAIYQNGDIYIVHPFLASEVYRILNQ